MPFLSDLFNMAWLERVHGARILNFPSMSQFAPFLRDEKWATDRAYIKSIVDHACVSGIGSIFFGDIPQTKVSCKSPNFRESLSGDGVSSRGRAVLELMATLHLASNTHRARIYAPEALTQFALRMRGRFPCFLGTEFAPSPADQARIYPIPHQDLCRLTLPDASFDVVVSNDVLEHVSDLPSALGECARVLRPGGVKLGTFPFLYMREQTHIKATLKDESIEYLVEPEYHGNPASADGKSLVFQIPGWEILDQCVRAGFSEAQMIFFSSLNGGITATELAGILVLCARK